MTPPNLVCLDHARRRLAVRAGANGIDYVRPSADRTALTIGFLQPWPASAADLESTAGDPTKSGGLEKAFRVRIAVAGGRAGNPPVVGAVALRNDAEGYGLLAVTLTGPADPLADYIVTLTELPGDGTGPQLDPALCRASFRFPGRTASRSPDCGPQACPPTVLPPGPPIDYLAKDYSSFRRLMFDRLAQTLPDWTERRAADLGVTVLEALAYAADHLSYLQDAVATEAYLGTARRRISVRRHARLVDYRMHDGCNARAWVQIEVNRPVTLGAWQFFTEPDDPSRRTGRRIVSTFKQLADPHEADRVVFEPLLANGFDKGRLLVPAQNRIRFFTWEESECCIPVGGTSAALDADPPGEDDSLNFATCITDEDGKRTWAWDDSLLPRVGDLLLLEEVMGPRTGSPADADPAHRCVVRLTRVEKRLDHQPTAPTDGKQGGPAWTDHPYLAVEWGMGDALPFAVCISTRGFQGVSVARGNVVLVDQGLTIKAGPNDKPLVYHLTDPRKADLAPGTSQLVLTAPAVLPTPKTGTCAGHDSTGPVTATRLAAVARFNPPLRRPLTQAAPFPDRATQAQAQARWLARQPVAAPDALTKARGGAVVAASGSGGVPAANILGPAVADLRPNPRDATPDLWLAEGDAPGGKWEARRDLLDSGPEDRHFVIEFDDWGEPWLRFGYGDSGRRPAIGTQFTVTYRLGNGVAGNVGAEAISEFLGPGTESVRRVRNPLPATGGTDPETSADVRRLAPTAFRTDLLRAVAAEDYARLAEQDDRVQRAAASLAWTGTGYEVQVAVDLLASATRWAADPVAEAALIREEVEATLGRYRRIGHAVRVVPPLEVPLEVGVHLWVAPHADAGRVEAAVRSELGSGDLPGGRRGFFHPDELTFAQSIWASAIAARARVPGVLAVEVRQLQRENGPAVNVAADGVLPLGPLEVARMDGDPMAPERGQLKLTSEGGR
jgi:predicted phage baseplate assembly protein